MAERPELYYGGVASQLPGNTTPGGNKPGGNKRGEGNSRQPRGFELLDRIEEPFDSCAVAMAFKLFYGMPSQIAVLAIGAGAPCKVAYALLSAVQLAMMAEISEQAHRMKIGPWTDNPDPDVWQDLGDGVNWAKLAQVAGEPLDIEGWQAYRKQQFGEAAAE